MQVFLNHPCSCFSLSVAQDWYLFVESALAVGPEVRTQLAEGVAGSVPYPWMLRQRKSFRLKYSTYIRNYQGSFFSLAYMPALLSSFFPVFFQELVMIAFPQCYSPLSSRFIALLSHTNPLNITTLIALSVISLFI